MLNRSVFIFACLCGCEFQLEERVSFRCPECGRLLVLEWRAEDGVAEDVDLALATKRSSILNAESR